MKDEEVDDLRAQLAEAQTNIKQLLVANRERVAETVELEAARQQAEEQRDRALAALREARTIVAAWGTQASLDRIDAALRETETP